MKTIDLSKEMQALKDKHGSEYYRNTAFTKEAAALWGASPNEHGVLPAMKEAIVNIGLCLGEIRFHKTSKGHWLIGINAMSSYTGKSYLPTVHDTIGYESRADARLAGVHKLIDFFEAQTSEVVY